ncbi:hypothetical protein BG004_006349 [Podila humilis]|nr:hypothetical protein BG004_006349 [Podila humilis]
MSESDLNLPTVMPLLQAKAGTPKHGNNTKAYPTTSIEHQDAIMQHPHLVPSSLKVETALLTKELSKFRACDQGTCFYCREWAQWVFKKTFGKEKAVGSEKKGTRPGSGGTGGGSPHLGSSSGSVATKKHKEYAMVVCERFYQRSTADSALNGPSGRANVKSMTGANGAGSVAAAAIAASKAGTGTAAAPSHTGQLTNDGFVAEIVDTVRDWIQQPSALYTSPEVFSLVDFEALYTAYPLQNQEQNQAQDDVTPILSTITIEKAHMILGHQGYPLLKRVTKAQLQNQIMNPTCQHTKGHSKSPADLELDKELFNEELKKMRMRDQEGLRKQIGPVWKHVEEALDRMDGAEKVRSGILSSTRGKEFAHTYKSHLISFQEIWTNMESSVKKNSSKKKAAAGDNSQIDPVEEVDKAFELFIDNMQYVHKQLTADVLESSERSLREFIKELAAAQTKILKLALIRIQEGKVGSARIDKILEESPEKCRSALKMVDQLIPIFDTKMAQFRVLVLNKLKEVDEEVEAVASTYRTESQQTVVGRLEKAANKDFRRRIKKLEFLSADIRKWFFQSRLTLFSSLDFATVCLNTLGILMEEAEVLEAVQLGLHDDHFRSRVLKSQEGRLKLAQQFREGVKTGRRVLAVMVSRLMMREGARAMGEMAAIQKEKKFLKSIGQEVDDNKLSFKGFLVPSRDVSPTGSAQVSDDEDAEGDLNSTAAVSKNKKKKDKKKKKAAEAAAAAAAAANNEVEVPVVAEEIQETAESAQASTITRAKLPTIDPLTAVSSKEARELKKQAKKDAKRQAKEVVQAEELTAAQAAAKAAKAAQHARELREAQEAIERQEAQEIREKQQTLALREKKAAEQEKLLREKKAASEEKRAAELEIANARKEQEIVERRQAHEAREVQAAFEREKAQEHKRQEQERKKQEKIQQQAQQPKVAKNASVPISEAPVTTFAQAAATPIVSAVDTGTPTEMIDLGTPVASNVQEISETNVPTWGPSAATLANRAASAAKNADRPQSWSKPRANGSTVLRNPKGPSPSKSWGEERSNWSDDRTTWNEKSDARTQDDGWGESKRDSWNGKPRTDAGRSEPWANKSESQNDGWGNNTANKSEDTPDDWQKSTPSTISLDPWANNTVKPELQTDGWGNGATNATEDVADNWQKSIPSDKITKHGPATMDYDDKGDVESLESLSHLPTQTLATLVHTLQIENKSLLTTLVSMQQQVSSLTERYSTLATLAREHEQQAVQAMESQKQREMEEVQRYVWKVEERCRQLEKHVLATHHHHQQMHMQQMQKHQQQQQQQHIASSGPPGLSGSVSSAGYSMPPPGLGNVLGLSRQGSAPSSPLLSQRGMMGPEAMSGASMAMSMPMPTPTPMSMSSMSSVSMGASNGMNSMNGLADNLQSPMSTSSGSTNMNLNSLNSVPPGFESGPKKTHWRQRGEVRCGNCAQLGHSSAECMAGCRYCDRPGHLSQDCPRIGETNA